MNTSDLQILIQDLEYQRHPVDYIYLAAATFLIYDYFLTLHLEIRFIWFARWSYTTALFLLIRYLGFVAVVIPLFLQQLIDPSTEMCDHVMVASTWISLLLMILAEVVLSLRTWVVWHRNKAVGIGLGFVTIAHFVLPFYMTYKTTNSFAYLPVPYPGFRGCVVVHVNPLVWVNFAVYAAVEAIVLILMVVSALRLYRQGNNSELAHVIHRDGIYYYVYLLVLNALNLAFISAEINHLQFILDSLEIALYAVLTCRIVLNIRAAGHRQFQPSELHTTFPELPLSAIFFHTIDDEHAQDNDLQVAKSNTSSD